MGRPRLHGGRSTSSVSSSASMAVSSLQSNNNGNSNDNAIATAAAMVTAATALLPSWARVSTIKILNDAKSGKLQARIPGVHIPIAFFSSLRANLQICFEDFSISSSNSVSSADTPDCLYPVVPLSAPGINSEFLVSTSLAPFSENAKRSLPVIQFSPSCLASPSLRTGPATAGVEREEAFRLISSSVVLQRQAAALSVILHPAVLLFTFILLALTVRFIYHNPPRFLAVIIIWAGCLTVALVLTLHTTRGYLERAEQVGSPTWLKEGLRNRSDGSRQTMPEDEIWITRYGDEIMGALVLRTSRIHTNRANLHSRTATNTLPTSSGGGGARARSHRHSNSSTRVTGVIRAWTIKPAYRLQGIGKSLLVAAVITCLTRKLDGPVFADDHVHSTRLLPPFFNKGLDRQEDWARSLLRSLIQEEGERRRPRDVF